MNMFLMMYAGGKGGHVDRNQIVVRPNKMNYGGIL